MKLIRTVDGQFVNVAMLENFMLVSANRGSINAPIYEVVGYAPSYCNDIPDRYVFAIDSKENAEKRLEAIIEWLTNSADDVFDAMLLWESDYE